VIRGLPLQSDKQLPISFFERNEAMNARFCLLLFASAALFQTPALAQKEKPSDVSNIPFWKGLKGGYAKAYVPGLNAVLALSDQQKEELIAAQDDTVGAETVREAGRKVKADASATEAQRQAAREITERAQNEFQARIAKILTAEQKALIANVSAAYEDVRNAVAQEFQQRYVAAKGNEQETANVRKEAQEKTDADFRARLAGMLSSEQNLALAKAAAEEKQRAAKLTNQKKP
jgi:hypothetical protein